MQRAIYINANRQTVQEITFDPDNLKIVCVLLGYDSFVVAGDFFNGDTVLVDHEGMVKNDSFFAIKATDFSGDGIYFAGNAIIINDEGDAKTKLSEICVDFSTAKALTRKHQPQLKYA